MDQDSGRLYLKRVGDTPTALWDTLKSQDVLSTNLPRLNPSFAHWLDRIMHDIPFREGFANLGPGVIDFLVEILGDLCSNSANGSPVTD